MSVRLLTGDCLDVLKTLDAESVQCCVTSPPYWGLRDYGTAKWDGGDPACAHRVGRQVQDTKAPGAIASGVRPGVDASRCLVCGAVRIDSQLGLEPTPGEYVEKMVDVFREVRRVLRDDGTLWLNIGDSYAGAGVGNQGLHGQRAGRRFTATVADKGGPGLKPKDLVGIPWRVAFALQADGWYLRSDIIWAKPNAMPESVTDRPTKAHEYLFLLSKSERYYYDADAIAEPVTTSTVERLSQPTLEQQAGSDRVPGKTNGRTKAVPPKRGGTKYGDSDAPEHRTKSGNPYDIGNGKRNRRTVWTVAPQRFSGAHFATMPPKLVEPCLLAGSKPGDTVLDPFGGAGTTGLVADRLGRDAVLIELNPEYVRLARTRITGEAPLLADVPA